MATTGKELTITDPETGEVSTIDPANFHSPTGQELGSLVAFRDIPHEPMAIVQIGWTEGKRQGIEGKPCGLIAYLQARTGRTLQGAYTFSDSVIKSLRNFEAAGHGTVISPVLVKPDRSGPTTAGYYVDKLSQLTTEETADLTKALLA